MIPRFNLIYNHNECCVSILRRKKDNNSSNPMATIIPIAFLNQEKPLTKHDETLPYKVS
jgi:hypothetical protein